MNKQAKTGRMTMDEKSSLFTEKQPDKLNLSPGKEAYVAPTIEVRYVELEEGTMAVASVNPQQSTTDEEWLDGGSDSNTGWGYWQ